MAEHKSSDALEFEIDFYEKILHKTPNYIDALIPLAEAYTMKGLYEKGLAADERLAKLCPEDPEIHYNLACSYALLNRPKQAIATLQKAVKFGYHDFKHLRKDPDLKSLAANAEFQAIAALG